MEHKISFDMLFGPAYKGIPLASSTAIALSEYHNKNVPICFNRKEKKQHGEKGSLIGAPLKGRVMIVDDVITAGTAIRESIKWINQANATLAGIIVALDRQERGVGELSAIQAIVKEYNVPVYAIINLNDLYHYIHQENNMQHLSSAFFSYRQTYGVDSHKNFPTRF
jgi:orotate phosphoribosyltransferase